MSDNLNQRDDQRVGFYVSVLNGSRRGLLGPFRDRETALAHVDTARQAAVRVDGRTTFFALGTYRVSLAGTKPLPVGSLNALLAPDVS